MWDKAEFAVSMQSSLVSKQQEDSNGHIQFNSTLLISCGYVHHLRTVFVFRI